MATVPQLGDSLLGPKFRDQFQEMEENHVLFLLVLWPVPLDSPQDGPAQGLWRLQLQALPPAGRVTGSRGREILKCKGPALQRVDFTQCGDAQSGGRKG